MEHSADSLPIYYDVRDFSGEAPQPILACPFRGQQGTLVFGPRSTSTDHHSFLSALNSSELPWASLLFCRIFPWKDQVCAAIGFPSMLRDQAQRQGLLLWIGGLFPRKCLRSGVVQAYMGQYLDALNIIFSLELPESGTEELISSINAQDDRDLILRFRRLTSLLCRASELAGLAASGRVWLPGSNWRRIFSGFRSKESQFLLISPDDSISVSLALLLEEVDEGAVGLKRQNNKYELARETAAEGIFGGVTVLRCPGLAKAPKGITFRKFGRRWYIRVS